MTNIPTTPAGWYPDPAGSPRNRWWDGTQWTENFHDPMQAAQLNSVALKAPEGTSVYNPFILTMIALLVLSLLSVFLILNPATFNEIIENSLAGNGKTSTAELISNVVGFVLYAAWVILAALDYRTLVNAGVPKPFHWAWTFLVAPSLYFIGRGVVTRRRTGKGIATMWIAIAYLGISFIIGIVIFSIAFGVVLERTPGLG
jgi:hypothetical protein